ncbi:ATP-binding protein [Aquipuribacter sp. MA13-6]|uniref:ATP-binding protein n=1 Tax=unclassified Aquipuribacter TaxID=2635084 RepID=UPI003EF03375
MTDDELDIDGFDGGLRTSTPPEGFRTVRAWTLHATSELSPFRNQLAEVLLAGGITIGQDRDSVASKIVLIASELAANALTHGRPPTEVWLRQAAPTWLLEVADHDTGTAPAYAGVRAPGEGGLGLHLARHLSLDVGWYTTDATKNIWVTFA